jgi:translation initiation factor 2B subunit (eIF-2B alpha/beta/delta family)
MKRCLYEAMQQIQVCKQEIIELTENLTSMSIALEEAKKQNASLDATIREMKKTPAQSIWRHSGQTRESDLASMDTLSKAFNDFESRLVETMKRNETRCVR